MATKEVNRLVGKAMHTYDMLADGDRVLVAVSGGVDSLVLLSLLQTWRKKAPIDYDLLAVHLDMGFGGEGKNLVAEQIQATGVPFLVEETSFGKQALTAENGKSACFHCAKQRRNRLFDMARDLHFSKIALGHHQEDIIETFFLNLLYSGNISTMVPRQNLFHGSLALIRPLAFVAKDQIRLLAEELGIKPIPSPCPLAAVSKREDVRTLLHSLYAMGPRVKSNIFAALANVKTEYLLARPRKSHIGDRQS